MSKKLLTPTEFAMELGISKWTVYQWLSLGILKKVKLGRLVRIPESEIDRLIQNGTESE